MISNVCKWHPRCLLDAVLKIPKDPHLRACIDASIQRAKPDSGDSAKALTRLTGLPLGIHMLL
jgi:hypothetical protein